MEKAFQEAQERIDTQIKQSAMDALILIEFRSIRARATITKMINHTFFETMVRDQFPDAEISVGQSGIYLRSIILGKRI